MGDVTGDDEGAGEGEAGADGVLIERAEDVGHRLVQVHLDDVRAEVVGVGGDFGEVPGWETGVGGWDRVGGGVGEE